MKRLLVVGNGFDLAHGYKTGYKDFYLQLPVDLKNDWDKLCEKYRGEIDSWYDFENAIGKITNVIFDNYFENHLEPCSEDNISYRDNYIDSLKTCSKLFNALTAQLKDYLIKIENTPSEFQKNENIGKYIDKNTMALSFNYTKFIEHYLEDVIYIHGSLTEDFIVFGYRLRGENDFIDGIATEFSKSKRRKMLEYSTFMKANDVKEEQISYELDIFLERLHHLYSGKGGWGWKYTPELQNILNRERERAKIEGTIIEDNFESGIIESFYSCNSINEARKQRIEQSSELMNSFYEHTLSKGFKTRLDLIDFISVKEIVIIGHSILGDVEIFMEISDRVINLEKITIFAYKYDQELNKQIKFLSEYFKGVIIDIESYQHSMDNKEKIKRFEESKTVNLENLIL